MHEVEVYGITPKTAQAGVQGRANVCGVDVSGRVTFHVPADPEFGSHRHFGVCIGEGAPKDFLGSTEPVDICGIEKRYALIESIAYSAYRDVFVERPVVVTAHEGGSESDLANGV